MAQHPNLPINPNAPPRQWHKWTVGSEVIVPGWWTKPAGQLVRCKIMGITLPWLSGTSPQPGSVFLKPLEGNPHSRYIFGDDLDKLEA